MDKGVASGARSYRDVARELSARLKDGRIEPGAFLPREREIQEEFGVARTTVRRALQELVDGGAVESVPHRGVRARGGAEPARGTRTLAFIDGSTLVLGRMYADLSRRFLADGDHLVHLDSQRMGLDRALAFAREKSYSGAFVWSFEGFPDVRILHAAAAEMPLVLLDHRIREFDADLVHFDNLRVGYDATAHLIAEGARRPAVTGMFDMLDVNHDRFSGFLKALFDHGVHPSAADFAFARTSGDAPPAPQVLGRRLADTDRPDGLLVLQDEFLSDALRVVGAVGLRVPEDIRLVVLGDDTTAEIGGVPLPAIRFDWSEFTDHAFHLMKARLDGHSGPPERRVAAHALIPSSSRDGVPAPAPALVLSRSPKS